MTETQFWWANVDGYDDNEVVEVRFEHGKPLSLCFAGSEIGIAADNFDQHGVRLIERVLPAGRVTAAGLRDALDASSRNGGGFLCRSQDDDDEGKPTGPSFTVIDGYFDLERAAAILQGGDA